MSMISTKSGAPSDPAKANVTSTHPDYDRWYPKWRRLRDVIEGGDAIKDAGIDYLPQNALDTDEYEAYKMRADWLAATELTIVGMLGLVFRKELEWDEMDEAGEKLMEDVTLNAEPLNTFAKNLLEQILDVSRAGFLIDVQQEESPTARPYFVLYRAEQIINWKSIVIDGKEIPTLIVLSQAIETDPDPQSFGHGTTDQYLVLRLTTTPTTSDPNETGEQRYIQEYWEAVTDEQDKSTTWKIVKTVTPIRRGKALDRIPFFVCNLTDTRLAPQKPLLIDLANLNISHYRSSADLEQSAHFVASPTPWITGLNDDQAKLKIGSQTAWVIKDKDAEVGMLEMDGQGLEPLEKRLAVKQEQMAAMGASLVRSQKKEAETAETTRMQKGSEASVLMTVVDTVSSILTQGVNALIDWANGAAGASEAKVELNKDLLPVGVTPQELDSWVKSFQASAMSFETLFYNMKRGGLTRPNVEFEEELEQIELQRGAPLGEPTPEEAAFLEEEENADPNADPDADPEKKKAMAFA